MTGKQPRFSRRFLTILMVVTAIAIALLSRTQPPQEPEQNAPQQQSPQQ